MTTLTKKTLGVSLLCGLLLVGCNNKKEEPKTETKKEEAKEVTTVAPNCDDANVKNSLVKALSFATNEEVTALMANYNDAEKLDLVRGTQERLGEISLDLQNVKADGESCVADMVATVPSNDLERASTYYKNNNKPSIDELAQSHSLSLSEGRVSSAVRYSIKDNQATLDETPKTLAFIADVMSASAYRMAQSKAQAAANNARPAVKAQQPKPAEAPRPKPVVRERETTQERGERPQANENANEAVSNTAEQNTQRETAPQEAPKKEPTPREAPKEPAQKEPKPASDNNHEIAIEETDDTY